MRIDFEPSGIRTQVQQNETLISAASEAGIVMKALCGGNGTCGKCRIQITGGSVPPVSSVEERLFSEKELADGWRLACRIFPEGDMKVYIPPESMTVTQRLQSEGSIHEVYTDPVIYSVDIIPDIKNSSAGLSYEQLYIDGLAAKGFEIKGISYNTLKELPTGQSEDDNVKLIIREGTVIRSAKPDSRILGVAFDAGTTKLAGYLVDLETGNVLLQQATMNPQIAYGEDVVSRIAYCALNIDGLNVLRSTLLHEVNSIIGTMCSEAGCSADDIVEAVIVGNTAVHHFLCGFSVRQLGMSPYVPTVSGELNIKASEFGININPNGYLYIPGNIAGYIGGDHTAALLSAGTVDGEDTVLLLDIGTNTEVTLTCRGKSLSCSCASGPAFEGAHIKNGMRAAEGAIEGILFKDGSFLVSTIGKKPAIGICGSGILDGIAALKNGGFIDDKGNFVKNIPGLTGKGLDRSFIIVPKKNSGNNLEISISRGDINEIQLAKAAIRSGIDILLKRMEIQAESLDKVIIAGAFGTYLNIGSAIEIGLLPAIEMGKYHQVGNAAGDGAKQMLLSKLKRKEANNIPGKTEFVELNSEPGFRDIYLNNMYIKDLNIDLNSVF
jgi:uncharacterized 2Fe-2S/4Fe-4S cluster protein (DUF4445 family)